MTSVDICNQAISLVGEAPIASLSDVTKTAKLCNANYDISRRAVLRMHLWNFAVRRVIISPDVGAPVFGFAYAFTLPTDNLRVLEVNEGDEQYRLEGGKILMDSNELRLKYIYDVTTVALFDTLFVDALACYIAFKVAYAISQSSEVRDSMWQCFQKILPKARFVDATEDPMEQVQADDLVNSRLSGSGFVRDPMT